MCGSCFMPKKIRVGREYYLIKSKHLTQKTASKSENVAIFSCCFFSPKTILMFMVSWETGTTHINHLGLIIDNGWYFSIQNWINFLL